MGWFKKIFKKVKKSPVGKALDALTAAYVAPVKTFKAAISKDKTIAQVAKAEMSKPLGTQIAKTVLSTVGYASAVVGAGAVATAAKAGTLKAAAGTAARSLIPKTAKGKIIAAVAAPAVIGAVVREPVKTIKAAGAAPGELAQFGGDVASFISKPSVEGAKQIVKESPIISGVVGAGAVAAAGLGAASVIGGVLTRKEMQKQTAALEQIGGAGIVQQPATPYRESFMGVPGQSPILPQTQTISTGKKPYKRRRAKKTPSVRQSVRVNIINRPINTGIRVTNKRYLNQELLN